MKQILYIIGFIFLATVITAGNYYSIAPVAASATIGDFKSGAQPTDHNGWILLNGRLKTSLNANQQANATTFGVGANLPVGNGRAFIQGTILAQIGSTTITQANLPAVNLVGGNHAHAITDPGHTHQTQQANNGTFNSNGAAGAPVGFGNSFTTSANTTGISIQSSGNLSIPLGGSGTAYTPAGIGCNQFIYLGN
jgi:multidrug efflux pump subunit AcrA (membrane-fusion protein)